MTKKLLIIALTAMAAGIVIADDDAHAVLDTDNDGSISRAEATALPGLTEQFAALDTDVNDKLSVEEFAKFETPDSASEYEPRSAPEPQ
ncbi:MAG: hypothetical protein L3J24_11765 [Xanthomonadales bacterium]|nr:hypothetical protein [Xanthomonadales bacterium]